MRDGFLYLAYFYIPFSIVYILTWYTTGPGNLSGSIRGALAGIIVLSITWLTRNGIELPNLINRKLITASTITLMLLFIAAQPLEAGAPEDPMTEQVPDYRCSCLGSSAVYDTNTGMTLEFQPEKFCWGITYRCEEVDREEIRENITEEIENETTQDAIPN